MEYINDQTYQLVDPNSLMEGSIDGGDDNPSKSVNGNGNGNDFSKELALPVTSPP